MVQFLGLHKNLLHVKLKDKLFSPYLSIIYFFRSPLSLMCACMYVYVCVCVCVCWGGGMIMVTLV